MKWFPMPFKLLIVIKPLQFVEGNVKTQIKMFVGHIICVKDGWVSSKYGLSTKFSQLDFFKHNF